eukprot:GILK01005558.1.p1 GENE.GILK01005558.1~~GILK01005558.1.p1  ORF type:complete len:354 (+),score=62.71 GILK01005558.1:43-1104(+)
MNALPLSVRQTATVAIFASAITLLYPVACRLARKLVFRKLKHLKGQDILSVTQFSREEVEAVLAVAKHMKHAVKKRGVLKYLEGKVLATLFYEPSTRTSSSFVAAMLRLGGRVVPIHEVSSSSVAKGETLSDTIKCLQSYTDAIVIRHPKMGAAREAADAAIVPVLNAGDGVGEHPTQALLDLFTIQSELGRIDGLHVTMVGDLKNGRTVHSLSKVLALFNVHLHYVSPESLRMPFEIKDQVESVMNRHGIPGRQSEHRRLEEVLALTDVMYVTRVQKERFERPEDYEAVKDAYVITSDTLIGAKTNMIIMHPLPRVNEIAVSVDSDPRAAYFRQMENGMYVRMALLGAVCGV